jgi:hypothetical protein
MKRILLLFAAMSATALAFAQSQRMELYEEFSGENSAPSAAVNPAWNILLKANPVKIASITYESNIPNAPGNGSIYRQTRSDVRAREAYYQVPHAPYGRFDGQVINNPADTSKNGSPALMTQNIIDTAYRLSSPFTVTLSHTFHPFYDSVVVSMTITASQPFTAPSTLKAWVAMEETAIHLSAPTGSSGEKDFYNVFRMMLPVNPANTGGGPTRASLGYTLPNVWTNGQSQTISMTVAVPSYIYDKSQIAFVAFVQDSATYQVEQAAFSAAQPMKISSRASALYGPGFLNCGITSVTPVVTIQDIGTDTLVSCTINLQLDANPAITQNWTGSLKYKDTLRVTLAPVAVTPGPHTLAAWTTIPNGHAEINTIINKTLLFNVEGAAIAAPLIQGFTPSGGGPPAFPPPFWIVVNATNGGGGGGGGFGRPGWRQSNNVGDIAPGSATINFMATNVGEKDYLYAQNVDLSAAPTATCLFNLAHIQARTESDSLIIQASSNCGTTWSTVYAKGGAGLATAPSDTNQFTPSAAQWRSEAVNLNSFAGTGNTNVLIRFKGVSAGGNTLFIDDINISNSPMSVRENTLLGNMKVYPNPFSDNATIALDLKQAGDVKITLTNVLGQVVYSADKGLMQAGQNLIAFNGSSLSQGLYFLNITSGNKSLTQKVTISK